MKRLIIGVLLICLIACTAILISACGGGGGGSSSSDDGIGPPPATTLVVDEASAAKLVGVAMFGQTVGSTTGSTDFIPIEADASRDIFSNRVLQTVLNRAREVALAQSSGYQIDGSVSGTEGCISANLRWTGPNPNYVQDCSDMSNLSGTMTFNNCSDVGSNINGRITLSISGSLCSPTAVSMTFTNFSLSDAYDDISFSCGSLQISVSEITYSSGTGFITHSRSTIHGDISGTMGAESYDADFYQLTQVLETADNSNFVMDLSGSIRGGCLEDQWASIDTVASIEFNTFEDCPTAGELLFSGDGEITVIFLDGGGVQVGNDVYDSCTLVDTACSAPL